jgi:antibiotic biosynthesis monooxygenase (ABM) superfamily enzyme
MEKLKRTLIVWVSIYPLITIILLGFGKPLSTLPIALRTLVLTAVLVPIMVYILIPFWTRVFNQLSAKRMREGEVQTPEASSISRK